MRMRERRGWARRLATSEDDLTRSNIELRSPSPVPSLGFGRHSPELESVL